MSFSNNVSRTVAKLDKLPEFLRSWALTKAIGGVVKMLGACKVKIHYMTFSESKLSLANHKKVQNHIGGVHACGTALLAESATGMVVGMNVQDSCVPVLKTIKIDYLKRANGGLTAMANLTDEQIDLIRSTEKGEVVVPVKITDEDGQVTVDTNMVWAWVPKKRK